MIKIAKVREILEYILVFLAVFSSGAVVFQNQNQLFMILILLFVVVYAGLRIRSERTKKWVSTIKREYVLFCFLYVLCMMVHYGCMDASLVSESGNLCRFVTAYLLCSLIPYENFSIKYRNVVLVLAISSVILYLIPFVLPTFPEQFPIVKDYAGSSFHNAYLFCYPTYIGQFYRNQSIFWECGAYQAFLNVALFMELYGEEKPRWLYVIGYGIALLTTQSTTAYIIFMMLLVGRFLSQKMNSKMLLFGLVGGAALVWLVFYKYGHVIFDKFSSNSTSYVSFVRRFTDCIVDVKLIFSSFMGFVFGVGEKLYISAFTEGVNTTIIGQYKQTASSNSITAFAAQYGLFCSASMLGIYFGDLKRYKTAYGTKTVLIALVGIIIIFMTENFFMVPVFLMLAFYKKENLKNLKN